MAFNLIESWDDVMASKNEQEKTNMMQVLNELKRLYDF